MYVFNKLLDRLVDKFAIQNTERCMVRREGSDSGYTLILLETTVACQLGCGGKAGRRRTSLDDDRCSQ